MTDMRNLTLLLTLLCATLLGCQTSTKQPNSDLNNAAITTYVYQCSPSIEFVARQADDQHIWLFLPQETLKLPRVKSGSGVKYQLNKIMFWQHHGEAMLSIGDIVYKECKNNPREAIWQAAKLNGADFRAIGNEPGWHLIIEQENTIILTTQYGQRIDKFSQAKRLLNKNHTIYRAKNGQDTLHLTLSIGPCTDSMSGEKFETNVSLTLNDQPLQGCGKSLH